MKLLSSTSSSKHSRARRLSYPKRFGVFFLLIFLMLIAAFVCVKVLEQYTDDRTSTQMITKYQMEDFYALPQNSLDVLIMGSSHAMCTYNPYSLGREFDANFYNLGTALQQPDTAYHLLREVYKTQTPKLLIYDVYFKVMQMEKGTDQAETVLLELEPSYNKLAFWWNNLDMDGRVRYVNTRVNPFGRLYSILSNWQSARTARNAPRNENYLGNGFYVTKSVVSEELLSQEKHPFSKEYAPFTQRQTVYLRKMVELAREKGTRVVFVTAPIPPTILSRVEYYDKLHADAQALADELGVEYYDFCQKQLSGELELSDKAFADQGHLNREGADAFNAYFTQEMRDVIGEGGESHE